MLSVNEAIICKEPYSGVLLFSCCMMSLMNSKNNVGHSADPWGTGHLLQIQPLTKTFFVLPSRNEPIHFRVFPLMPLWFILAFSLVGGTRLNALLKLRIAISICFLWFSDEVRSCTADLKPVCGVHQGDPSSG